MVFRRKRSFRRAASAARGYVRRTYGGRSVSPSAVILPAFVYGAARARLSSWVQQVIPGVAGQYTDEIVLGLAGWYLAKKNTGFLRNIGMAALTIESASVGNQMVGSMLAGNNSTTRNAGGIAIGGF